MSELKTKMDRPLPPVWSQEGNHWIFDGKAYFDVHVADREYMMQLSDYATALEAKFVRAALAAAKGEA
jgi:hypothetical protein